MKNTNKKLVIAVIALAVALACTLAVAVAWLADTTEVITNTFTVGNVTISISETGASEGAKTYSRIKPGDELGKDAALTVAAGSEDCYLYVKVVATNNAINEVDSIIDYTIDAGWTALDGVDNVWYRSVSYNASDAQTFNIFTGNKVTVDNALTSDDLADEDWANPTIAISGYAVQSSAGEYAKDAWTAAGFN